MSDMNEQQSVEARLRAMEGRLFELEAENRRLRENLGPIIPNVSPDFSLVEFQKAARFYLFAYLLPVIIVAQLLLPVALVKRSFLPRFDVLPGVPMFDFGGQGTRHPGIGLGVIAAGGVSFGAIAVGGCAVGIVAIGGGSIGIFAFGGGALGLIAVGGGAIGYIAMGGGGIGRYVLAMDGRGKYIFTRRRQDPEAVELFGRYMPRLKRAFRGPLPVIPLG